MRKRLGGIALGTACFAAGLLAAQFGAWPALAANQNANKPPAFQHAFNLYARKATEQNVTDETVRFGVEVFRDENNGNLIYLSDTGDIAVVPVAAD